MIAPLISVFIFLAHAQAAKISPCDKQTGYRFFIANQEGLEIKCISHKKKPAYASIYYLNNKAVRGAVLTKKSFKAYQSQFKKAFAKLPSFPKKISQCSDSGILIQDKRKKSFCGDEIDPLLRNELTKLYSSVRTEL